MENNEQLIRSAIELHYHNRPQIVSNAMQLIENYCCKEQTDLEYDEILKSLHELMNDLPSNILLYFFTIVPLPKQRSETNSTFFELMKKSRASLLDNMSAALTEYINNAKLDTVDNLKCEKEVKMIDDCAENTVENAVILDHILEPSDCASYSCESLLNICSNFVIDKLPELDQLYKSKSDHAWDLLDNLLCNEDELTQVYAFIEDINKKRKWLRTLETEYFSVNSIQEMYKDEQLLLKERHLHNIIDEEAFTLSNGLKDVIKQFLSR